MARPEQSLLALGWAIRLGGPLLFGLFQWLPVPADFPPAALPVAGLTLWMALWWLTEAVPMAATALLPLIVLPLSGTGTFAQAATPYSNETILLFLGSFVLGAAIERWNLHRRLSLLILHRIGADMRWLLLGFMGVTAFISMWISNTATCAMMLPIGLALTTRFSEQYRAQFGKAVVLGIAYAASLGGLGTPIGTPTNGIFLSNYQQYFGRSVGFLEWMGYAVPLMVVLLLGTWAYLAFVAHPLPQKTEHRIEDILGEARTALGKTTAEEWLVLTVFGAVALCWFGSKWLATWLPGLNDAIIALSGALLLFLLPAPSQKGTFLMDWPTAERIPWGVLLLFGGGLSLAEAFRSSGLSDYLGNSLSALQHLPGWAAALMVLVAVVALSEIASNVATASMMLPILAVLSAVLGQDPFAMMFGATLAASCGFMLPVATAPNALAFGTGTVSVRDMARAGLFLDLLCVGGIWLLMWLL
jgi:sodium-dependent dicarboxylate transporter 2/3/5